jgi:hypothetical protein
VGHGSARHCVAQEALRWLKAGEPSISRSSTCTCRRWTASRSRKRIRADHSKLPMVLFSSLGRREGGEREALFAAYLAKPLRQSQLSTR